MNTLATKERGIIFSGPMVRAILEGRKTQTRRLMKHQPAGGVRYSPFVASGLEDRHGREIKSPYGQPGDRLWVRETFHPVRFPGKPMVGIHYTSDGHDWLGLLQRGQSYAFPKGDGSPDKEWPEGFCYPKRPSIHMPRWASRILLEIVRVRVQRIRDISEDDARAEGYQPGSERTPNGFSNWNAQHEFEMSWRKTYPRSWDWNDWVFVIEFKRISAPAEKGKGETE